MSENTVAGKVTIDQLAVMINKGFKESKADLLEVRTELKKDISDFRDEVNDRFDRLEKVVYRDHGRRLRKVESKLQIA